MPEPRQRFRRGAWQVVKWILFAILIAFIGKKALELWRSDDLAQLEIHSGWLIPAAALNGLGWLPSVWFWQRTMHSLGARPHWWNTLRAYYCGHLGKYIPGKAAVLVIRSGMLRGDGVPVATSALSATLETLGVMGVGLAVSIALAPFALPPTAWERLPSWLHVLRDHAWSGPLLIGTAALIVIPIVSLSLVRVTTRLANQELSRLNASVGRISNPSQSNDGLEIRPTPPLAADFRFQHATRDLLLATLTFIPTWLLQGLSLGCVLRSLGESNASLTNMLTWSCAVSAGTSLGFFALFAPGGLGIREGLIIAALQPTLGGRAAITAAALLRLVWFATELTMAGVLYVLKTPGRSQNP